MTAEDRITAYLFANKSKIEFSTLDLVVEEVKLRLFYGMSPISDDEIRKIVSRWALINAVGLLTKPTSAGTAPAKPGTPPPASDSELIDTVKKAISTLNAGVTIGKKGGNINIGVTGLTANLQKGADSSSLGVSWGGTLKAEAVSGPFHFAASLSKESWSITLSFPQDTYLPDRNQPHSLFLIFFGQYSKFVCCDAAGGFYLPRRRKNFLVVYAPTEYS